VEITRFADLCPRTIWDILDDAFDLYRERFALLAGVSAVAYVPTLLATLALTFAPIERMLRSRGDDASSAASLEFLGAYLVAVILLVIAQAMQTGATCIVVEDRLSGVSTTIVSAWIRMLQRLPPLLIASLLSGLLIVVIGTPTMGIAEVFYTPMISFLPQAIVLEKRGVVGGFRRAGATGQANYGKILGLVLLTRILGIALFLGVLGLLLTLVYLIPSSAPEKSTPHDEAVGFSFFLGIVGLAILLVAPLHGIASTLLYYDVRVRREGIDIEAVAVDQSYPLAPDYFGGVTAASTPAPPLSVGKRRRGG